MTTASAGTLAVADLRLRAAGLDDAAFVADLYTSVSPDDPEDPVLIRHWWQTTAAEWTWERYVAERDGRPVGLFAQGHPAWEKMPERYSRLQFELLPELRTAERLAAALTFAEGRAAADGALRSSSWAWERDLPKRGVLEAAGFQEERRQRHWELDLRANRERLERMAEASRERMREQGIRLLTLAEDPDPERYRKIWRMSDEAERDVPTTVPHVAAPFEELVKWLASPGLREDRIWIARRGDEVLGISMLSYPPTRGIVTTDWTGTARSIRGRGVARALKCETVVQAIALGIDRVRTDNDFRNAPILHLNEAMGYRLRAEMIQFIKEATPA